MTQWRHSGRVREVLLSLVLLNEGEHALGQGGHGHGRLRRTVHIVRAA